MHVHLVQPLVRIDCNLCSQWLCEDNHISLHCLVWPGKFQTNIVTEVAHTLYTNSERESSSVFGHHHADSAIGMGPKSETWPTKQ